jgi:hypothetical protein
MLNNFWVARGSKTPHLPTTHTPRLPLGPLSGPGGDALLLRRLHLVFERRHLVGVCARRGRAKFGVMYMMCSGREGQ